LSPCCWHRPSRFVRWCAPDMAFAHDRYAHRGLAAAARTAQDASATAAPRR
jgi:hypothetical protein